VKHDFVQQYSGLRDRQAFPGSAIVCYERVAANFKRNSEVSPFGWSLGIGEEVEVVVGSVGVSEPLRFVLLGCAQSEVDATDEGVCTLHLTKARQPYKKSLSYHCLHFYLSFRSQESYGAL
jgi:hypothetical protein